MMESNRIWRGLEQELGRRHRVDPGRQPGARRDRGARRPLRAVARHGARVRHGLPPREPGRDPGAPARNGAGVARRSLHAERRSRGAGQGDPGARRRGRQARRAPLPALRGRGHRDRGRRGSAACGPRAGPVRARTVVCAAGAWSARVLRPLGLRLPQRWVRATVARTDARAPAHARRRLGPGGVVPPAPGRHAQHRRRRRGRPRHHAPVVPPRAALPPELLEEPEALPVPPRPAARCATSPACCPGPRRAVGRSRGTGSLEPEPQPGQGGAEPRGAPRPLSRRSASSRSRGAGRATSTPRRTRFRSWGRRGRPGLVLATGFTGHGFAMGPIVGRLVAELVTDGKPSLDLRPFRFSRFAEGAVGRAAERALASGAPFDQGPIGHRGGPALLRASTVGRWATQ